MSNRFLKNRFRSIIGKYLKGRSTAEEQDLVDYFYDGIQDEKISESKLSDVEKDLKNKITQRIHRESSLRLKRFTYLKIASCIALLILSSLYIYNRYHVASRVQPIEFVGNRNTETNPDPITPVFTFEDGESYMLKDRVLESLSYKLIDGEKVFIIPEQISANDREKKLNQIKNPTDKVFAFLLQDGTTAWLNPNSTLDILPDMDEKRIVKIEGTVLFDVQRIKSIDGYKPFVVKTALQTIEVLGTKFIVNSVSNLEDVLLLEGKVKLTHNKYQTAVILKPNQKASLKEIEPQILVTKSSDNYKIEAWHKGLFHFENEKIADVMAEISQWYEQDIIVEPTIKDIPITGMISRYKNIDEVLELIELTNNVRYHRAERRIYIE